MKFQTGALAAVCPKKFFSKDREKYRPCSRESFERRITRTVAIGQILFTYCRNDGAFAPPAPFFRPVDCLSKGAQMMIANPVPASMIASRSP